MDPKIRKSIFETIGSVVFPTGATREFLPSSAFWPKPPPRAPSPPRPHPSKMLAFPRKNQASGEGAGIRGPQPPPPLRLFRRRGVYRHLILPTTSTTPARRGRRTSPACGSCRRPRKSVSARGERDREERDKPDKENEERERRNESSEGNETERKDKHSHFQ